MKNKVLIDSVIAETLRQPTSNEVDITAAVAITMKQKRAGLFQNEVDYRILAPSFKSLENDCHASSAYRADLVGYSKSGFTVAEFKIYDEHKRTKNPWGVLHFLRRDVAKLDALAKSPNRLWGDLYSIIAIRNTDFDPGYEQQKSMLRAVESKDKKPQLRGFRYYPILLVLETFLKRKVKWDVEIVTKNETAFLIARRQL
jgi:hypothetical protein